MCVFIFPLDCKRGYQCHGVSSCEYNSRGTSQYVTVFVGRNGLNRRHVDDERDGDNGCYFGRRARQRYVDDGHDGSSTCYQTVCSFDQSVYDDDDKIQNYTGLRETPVPPFGQPRVGYESEKWNRNQQS